MLCGYVFLFAVAFTMAFTLAGSVWASGPACCQIPPPDPECDPVLGHWSLEFQQCMCTKFDIQPGTREWNCPHDCAPCGGDPLP